MSLREQIIQDLETLGDTCKKVRPFDLRELGYLVNGKKVKVRNSTFEVREVKDIDQPRRIVSFCFLFNTDTGLGVVLPYHFSRYQKKTSYS